MPPVDGLARGLVPAAVRGRDEQEAALPLDVGSVHATLLVVDPDVRLCRSIRTIAAIAEPAAFSLGTPDRPAPAPPRRGTAGPAVPRGGAGGGAGRRRPGHRGCCRPPRGAAVAGPAGRSRPRGGRHRAARRRHHGGGDGGPDRRRPAGERCRGRGDVEGAVPGRRTGPQPSVAAGEVLVELTPGEPVDPRVVGALAASFGGVTMHLEPASVLERVHQLAASGSMRAALRVRSYQLQHPDQLPRPPRPVCDRGRDPATRWRVGHGLPVPR